MTEKLKVLLTIPSLQGLGGVPSYYQAVLPHLPPGLATPLEIGSDRNSGGLLYPLIDQLRFRTMLKESRPCLVHLNPSLNFKSFIRDGVFAWQAKKMGYPLLVFWHGWDKNFESKVAGRFRGFFKATFGKADGFIVLSSEFEEKLRDWGVVAPIYRETTCVADKLLAGIGSHRSWTGSASLNPIRILFLARLERKKGVFETLWAVRLLLDKQIPIRLTIAGAGKIRAELEAYAVALDLSRESIHFVGDVRGEDKVRAFTKHHIYCFPTYYGEGLPNSVLEAMAFGMPVVTRPVGGLADFFVDGKMGALVRGKSPEEIAACLEKLILDQDKMAEIGQHNAEYARKHFLASIVAARIINIYSSLVQQNG